MEFIPHRKAVLSEDPTEAAYAGLFFEMARAVQKKAPEYQVEYIIDDSANSENDRCGFQRRKNQPSRNREYHGGGNPAPKMTS